MFKNNSARLRLLVPLLVIVLVSVGFILNFGTGTLSAFGWEDIVLLCPLGALGTMLAAKLLIPQAVVSLVVAVALIVLLGPVFCGWICPVPLVQKLRGIFGRSKGEDKSGHRTDDQIDVREPSGSSDSLPEAEFVKGPVTALKAGGELSDGEKASLKSCASGCGSCASKREKFDSRHLILGGSLLSAAVFGFPVFCLVCPIGLSFATILLVIRLFSGGDVTLALLVVPALLIIEVVVFRKWCSKLCPLSAFMSLIAKVNKTFKPQVDTSKCIESSQGRTCGLCAVACGESINPRYPELGARGMNECTRCRVCVDACPGNALSIPVLPKKNQRLGSAPPLQNSDVEA
jgi:ferredoxin-type protein NapH